MSHDECKLIPQEPQGFGTLNEALEETLEIISDELIKKGTLSSDTVDWPAIESNCRSVLAQASHMLAFRGMVLSLIEKQNPEDLGVAFEYGAELFLNHFPKLHPQGKKFQRKKDSWAIEITVALTKAAEATPRGHLAEEGLVAGQRYCENAQAHGLDVGILKSIMSGERKQENHEDSEPVASRVTSNGETAARLDAKGRAQLRRDIQSLAHKIFTHMPDAAISYNMRGFAGWMEFQFLPEADAKGKTQTQRMPVSVYDDHQRALARPSKSELQRIEERLISNPDWFQGHHLAYQAAQALGYGAAAEAIRRRVSDRLEQWPDLLTLCYSNDEPFVSDEIGLWATGEGASPIVEVEEVEGPSDNDSGDFAGVLAVVNQQVEAAVSSRDKALAKLTLLRAFKRLGHNAQAKAMVEELLQTISDTSVKEWDQQLIKDIQAELK